MLPRLAFGLVLLSAATGRAEAQPPPGTPIESTALPTLGGPKEPLTVKGKVNVVIFFRTGQEYSKTALAELAALARDLEGKSVHWAAVVSDRFPAAAVKALVAETGLKMPVLVDAGDAVYARLLVIMHPTVIITDAERRLTGFEAFAKINFRPRVRARILHALKELTDKELDTALNPPEVETAGATALAKRNVKMAERLLKVGNVKGALESAKKALERDPKLAAAHAIHGAALAAQGDCPGALRSFKQALALDGKDPTALEGQKGCETSARR